MGTPKNKCLLFNAPHWFLQEKNKNKQNQVWRCPNTKCYLPLAEKFAKEVNLPWMQYTDKYFLLGPLKRKQKHNTQLWEYKSKWNKAVKNKIFTVVPPDFSIIVGNFDIQISHSHIGILTTPLSNKLLMKVVYLCHPPICKLWKEPAA